MSTIDTLISVVIPCFNEESAILALISKINKELASHQYEIILIDDGSRDNTSGIIKQIVSPKLRLITFSKNYGQQTAIYAGLQKAEGDYILVMDADREELLPLIPEMIQKLKRGYRGVFLITLEYESVGAFKRTTARLFYRVYNIFSARRIDERIMSFLMVNKSVADDYLRLNHNHYIAKVALFALAQPVALIQAISPPRMYGETKYSTYKMLKLAFTAFLVACNLPYVSSWALNRKMLYTLKP